MPIWLTLKHFDFFIHDLSVVFGFKIKFLVILLPCLEFSLVHSSRLDLYYECTFYGAVVTQGLHVFLIIRNTRTI